MSMFGEIREVASRIFDGTGAIPVDELARRVREGDPGTWQETSGQANELVERGAEHERRGTEILQALESVWEGAGADLAAHSLRTAAKVTTQATDAYRTNAELHESNAHSFENLKRNLPEIPEAPERGVVDVVMPWATDTEARIQERNQKLMQVKNMYDGFETSSTQAQSSLVEDYGGKPFDWSAFTPTDGFEHRSGGAIGSGVIDINEPRGGTGPTGPTGGPVQTGGPVPSSGPVQSGPVQSGGPDQSGPVTGGSVQPNGPQTGTAPSDGTGTSGYTSPDSARPPAASVQNPGRPATRAPGRPRRAPVRRAPGRVRPASGPSAPVRARVAGPAAERVGSAVVRVAPWPRPGRHARCGRCGQRLRRGSRWWFRFRRAGSGRMTGGMPPGGAAGAGSTGGAGTAAGASGGAGARGGAMPVGGAMGGGAGRGQGAQDEDHQRKYVVPTDEAFSLVEEEGEVLRDPTTGKVVTPPTIGEKPT
ncbi:hypothetical protein BJF85_16940 [Saccharomonospora sp. CUA-673]|uniref:hypothetical protein n=1 Tax=Saccharomonospora sp. CUA-673 TaxID=1904969 RepID=UPI00096782E0|nr:hypothetical protein [Saccharomonospora sp. CUA-673]OLT46520.1 hypothetical protein BJF85_16940 [Saccharomonospora sp. CUA-673]